MSKAPAYAVPDRDVAPGPTAAENRVPHVERVWGIFILTLQLQENTFKGAGVSR